MRVILGCEAKPGGSWTRSSKTKAVQRYRQRHQIRILGLDRQRSERSTLTFNLEPLYMVEGAYGASSTGPGTALRAQLPWAVLQLFVMTLPELVTEVSEPLKMSTLELASSHLVCSVSLTGVLAMQAGRWWAENNNGSYNA